MNKVTCNKCEHTVTPCREPDVYNCAHCGVVLNIKDVHRPILSVADLKDRTKAT
jgi:hypothetical protein